MYLITILPRRFIVLLPKPPPTARMVNLDHFAIALKAAEDIGSWRELADIATAVADKLE
jgi:hypothetical protein